MSEIDDIFASKGTHQQCMPSASTPKKKSKHKKNRKFAPPTPDKGLKLPSPSKKRPAPETVVDPSIQVAYKRPKVGEQGPKSNKSKEEQDDFRDSRGTGSRRKTEEGWNVYKEDELGIDVGAGDTPLCPFDCECCF